jgi:hypothetical protein
MPTSTALTSRNDLVYRLANVSLAPEGKKENSGQTRWPEFLIQATVGSLADIDGAQAIAERGEHPARYIASAVVIADATDVAEAAEVMMKAVEATTSSTTPTRMGGSCRGSQRHGAEGSCGNKCESQFA